MPTALLTPAPGTTGGYITRHDVPFQRTFSQGRDLRQLRREG
jgi:hypothetical protein